MKRKIFTLLLSACLGSMAMAQDAPTGVVKKASVAPVVDGYVDEVWAGANSYNFALVHRTETPTLGDPGETTWRALWTSEGIYVLVQVTDDVFMPAYKGTDKGATHMYDKPEVYFDCNAEKKDGLGAKGEGNGHYQFAPPFIEAKIGGGEATSGDESHGAPYAFHVVGSNYVFEYFVPFTRLLDGTGAGVDQTAPIGFDITVIDNDLEAPGRNRAVWANSAEAPLDESWNNMDGAGTITLSDEEAVGGGIVNKATVAPEIDGKVDAVWESANTYNVIKPFWRDAGATVEAPTLGESTWKALWNADGMFILLEVDDDNWYPNWVHGSGPSHMYDKPELYFDTNVPRIDGKGGQNNDSSNKGSIQIAPESKEGILDGSIQTFLSKPTGVDVNFAYLVTEPKYVVEYFVPWDALVDKDGKAFDKMTSMGFDVTLIDQDDGVTTTRNRAVWMNDGTGTTGNESWGNMDAAGVITFFGATPGSEVENITVTGGSITTDNGTLQMVAKVEPSDATQSVKWVVENGTGRAKIDGKGVLTGVANGTVMVKALAKDDSGVEGKTTVTISGQVVTVDEISIIKNGNFELGTDGKQDWGGPGTVTDSWYNVECTLKNEIWETMFGQGNLPIADASTAYTLKFKAIASADMAIPVLFEDRSNGNNKQLTTTSPVWDGGYGKFDVPITTESKWFTFDVIFSSWVENTKYELNFQVGKNEGTLSLDSIQLFSDADFALVTSARSLANAKSKVQLYPNPAQNELTVRNIANANSKVSVYNAVGQKLIERTANGTQAKFDVSNLRKGMYFVRFSDGTSQKFIKQ